MASISEMYKTVSAMQQDKLAADPWHTGAKAFGEGFEKGFGKQGIEQALKVLELKQKMKEHALKEEQYELTRNILQAKGIIPYDATEKKAARGIAFSSIGNKDDDPAAGIKTEQGKIATMVNDAAKDRSIANNKNYEIELGGDLLSGGVKANLKPVKKGEKATDLKRERDMAGKMAKQAFQDKMLEKVGGDRTNLGFSEMEVIKTYTPTPVEIEKFLPAAQAYLRGDKTVKKGVKKPKPVDVKKAEEKTAGGLNAIDDLEGIDDLWSLIEKPTQ